jgi:virginiamycin B lyase
MLAAADDKRQCRAGSGGPIGPARALVPLLVAALLGWALPAAPQNANSALPEGNGQEIVRTVCSQCHSLDNITRSTGYTRAGWENTVAMMRNAGAPLPPDQVATVVGYLAKNFPEKPQPPAVLIPGSIAVAIREWMVPTPGARPHDPLAAPDGTIWFTGHMANLLGHLDPKTGKITEYHPPIANSGPHGLTFDRNGDIWYTGNFKAYIGKFDPRTATFTAYHLDPEARDPHTPLFDRNGILWFTVQGADMVGRLDPRTGDVKLVHVPTPKANPYGMVITSKGVPYFAEFGTNALASIDPPTMAIHEYRLPNPEARPRRVAITPDDVIYYSDYARGYLGRFDTNTGAVSEVPSPGGPRSKPYGITFFKGAIWYSESAVMPNTLVRFDPGTRGFQTWAIPSGGGVVRNMMPMPDGSGIAMACSGVNRIALAEVK